MIKVPNTRKIKEILDAKPTVEGAGVHLNRLFSQPQIPRLDPFLLLDDFSSPNPLDYLPGFPWHPHRGIETVTYVVSGKVEHGDSLGNSGAIESGDVQWMTAGSGIIHQEMPKKIEDAMLGFQLWVNLPEANKMMAPRYRDVGSNQIPDVTLQKGVRAKVIAGTVGGYKGPTEHLVVDAQYVDISMDPYTEYIHDTTQGYKVFEYVMAGRANFSPEKEILSKQLVVFGSGDKVKVQTKGEGVRFLLVSGKPLNQPIAWHGPIVMNTRDELVTAFQEFQAGTFVKSGKTQHDMDDAIRGKQEE